MIRNGIDLGQESEDGRQTGLPLFNTRYSIFNAGNQFKRKRESLFGENFVALRAKIK